MSSKAYTEKVTFLQGDSQDEGLGSISSVHSEEDIIRVSRQQWPKDTPEVTHGNLFKNLTTKDLEGRRSIMTNHDNMSSIDYSAMFKAKEDYLMVAECE